MTWQRYTLDELGYVGRGKSRHRPRNDPKLYGGVYPFIQTADIQAAHMTIRGYSQTYSEAGLAQSKLWKEPTLCMTIAGENTGSTAILTFAACFPDSIVGFIPDPKKADIRFVKHSMDLMRRQFRSVSKGATQDNLPLSKILSFPLEVPTLDVQEKIASAIAAYDDLIENNRRRIALLEEAARLLYREWFVHFRFPGHEHVKIIDGIPEGWERKTLGDIAKTNEDSFGAKNLPDEINYVDISSVAKGRVVSRNKMTATGAPGRARRKAKDGDIIWSNVRPNLRAYALILDPDEADVFSTGFTVLTAREVPFTWLYQFVTTDNFIGHLVNHATGAGYPAVRPDDFERAAVTVPPNRLLVGFHDATESNFRLIAKLEQQNAKLMEARDLLLPRLMNGEIAV